MAEILTIIAPVFLIMMLGYGLGKTSLFPEGTSAILITFVWYVAIPALMFRSLAPKEFPSSDELLFVFAYYSSLYIVYALAYWLSRISFKLNSAEGGIFALNTCFANGVFVGVPVLEGMYGEEGVRLLLILLSFHSMTLLPVTTVILERALNKPDTEGSVAGRIIDNILHNPILIALAVGLTWSALSLPFPDWLDRLAALPGQAASPVGLFAAGLALSNVRVAGNLAHASLAIGLKLLLLPVFVFVVTEYIFALPAMWVGTATIMAALPAGMIGYSFASQYGVGARRAATTVLLSTALSAISLTIVLMFFKGELQF